TCGFGLRVSPQRVPLDEAQRRRSLLARGHRRQCSLSVCAHPGRRLAPRLMRLLPIALPVVGGTDAVDASGTGDGGSFRSIERHERSLALACLLDGLAQHAAISRDGLVRLTEMLARAVLDLAHGLAGPLVVHIDVGAHAGIGLVLLLVRIETVVVALVPARHVIRELVKLEALAAHLVL